MPSAWDPAALDRRFEPRSAELSLERFIRILRERWLIVVLAFVCAVDAAALYVTTARPVYEAQAELLVAPVSDPNLDGLSLIRRSSDPARDVQTAARLVASANVANRVQRALSSPDSPETLLRRVRAEPVAGSDIVAVIARGSTPATAKRLADAFAKALVDDRTARLQAELRRTIPRLQALVDKSSPAQSGAADSLVTRLAALQALEGGRDSTVQLENPASAPTSAVSPRKALSVLAGAIAGLMLGVGAALALDALDPRLRRESQLGLLFDLPVLTRVPWVQLQRRGRRAPLLPGPELQFLWGSYRLLEDALNAGDGRSGAGEGQSIVFTGVGRGQGATTSALHYAWLLANAEERITLVDGDLRRPAIGPVIGAQSSRYLEQALMGERSLEDALVSVNMSGAALQVLVTHDVLDQQLPEERIRSAFGKRLVKEILSRGDRVVIDAPPLTEGVDALSLARAADRLVVVVRLGSTRLAALRDLRDTLLRHGIRPDGIVIIGTRPGRDHFDAAPDRALRRDSDPPTDAAVEAPARGEREGAAAQLGPSLPEPTSPDEYGRLRRRATRSER
jgi:capsular polysaccharide biosynthesis protein/MinD-like ATPase involved in chromosome partitioning or flagellar assembly